ncbi:hypothetical protein HanRHA438_Chr09g0406791 [Helianthus annuus]|nr:hypothetical protein HanHA300_Chr09g0324061 [Helianthus annuus]KAJ0534965.1 hypothetical protein HanIR_Chr09g0425571 [Helianthus annuus]KAJ0542907.1 hypothetical protein HanHA89_Chr09g0344971 [Helianthus annuus]KAJ0707962.1 hypothetical protein HanLR1_Chr09g0324301 [Helianthus annuus]KAJ0711934.1 hypothetical protein HanOQP8_Chr09g0329381 [Helianthus annuus]
MGDMTTVTEKSRVTNTVGSWFDIRNIVISLNTVITVDWSKDWMRH